MARKRRMRGECVSAARKWVAAWTLPSSVRFADSFSLRAKCRLRRLHSDTRLRAQPHGEAFLTKIPPHLAARGLKFNFYCSFALMAASIARAASLPAPMARMTVAAPVTASPPA